MIVGCAVERPEIIESASWVPQETKGIFSGQRLSLVIIPFLGSS
jgi:hypothetical protein